MWLEITPILLKSKKKKSVQTYHKITILKIWSWEIIGFITYHLSNSFLLPHCINIKEETFGSNPTTMNLIIPKHVFNQETEKNYKQGLFQNFRFNDIQ